MKVEPFLDSAVGEYQDLGRGDIPAGYVWNLRDFVPHLLGAAIRGRGSWAYASPALGAPIDAMIYATFVAGGQLIVAAGGLAFSVPVTGSGAQPMPAGIYPMARQDPVFYLDKVFLPSRNNPCSVIGYSGGTSFTVTTIPVATAHGMGGQYGTVFRERLVLGGSDAQPGSIRFSKPSDPNTWNIDSIMPTNNRLTGLAAMRNQVLCMHEDYVEQLRGTEPPDSQRDPTLGVGVEGDMNLSTLWDRAGCFDGRSIAYWRENVLFADPRGVHITDGGIVRNIVEQGGMAAAWRGIFQRRTVLRVSAVVYGNLYICTLLIEATPTQSETWVCDIPTRRWYRWTNIVAGAHAVTSGTMERLFGADHDAQRVTNMDGCMNPNDLALQIDGNGIPVLPEVETGWQRLTKRVGLRRWYDFFLHYMGYRATDPGSTLINAWASLHPESTASDYMLLGGLYQTLHAKRRKLPIFRESEGLSLRVKASQAMNDFRIHSIGASVEVGEEHRVQ